MRHEKGRPGEAANPEHSAVAADTGDDTSSQPTILEAIAEADRRGLEGQRVALNASDVRWKSAAEAALRELAASGAEFTADDLHDRVQHLASSPHALGAIIGTAARRGEIVCVGVSTSTRASRHGGLQRRWVGAS